MPSRADDVPVRERDGDRVTSANLPCPECGQVFRRREHLNRHLDRHTGLRSHPCSICKRAFSRRDTLKRHIRTHGTAALAEWTQENEEQFSKSHRRACEACAKGKQRCDGHAPAACSSCTRKGRHCAYSNISADDWSALRAHEVSDDGMTGIVSSTRSYLQSMTPRPHGSEDAPAAMPDVREGVPVQTNLSEQPISIQPVIQPSPLSLEPDLAWDDFLDPGQFLFPFSPVPSLGTGALAPFLFEENVMSTAAVPIDDNDAQNSFDGEASARLNTQPTDASSRPEDMTAEEEDLLLAEHVPHVPSMTVETRAYMIQALQDSLPQHEAQVSCGKFPSLRHLDTYMQLYFEHCHSRMPFLHVPTFYAAPETWQLVLGVVCLGSQYSSAGSKQSHVATLQRIARLMLKNDVRQSSSTDVLTSAQSYLLLQQSLWASGGRRVAIELQSYRNILVTLCRQLLSREGTFMRARAPPEHSNDAWSQWRQAEAERRVIYFTWMAECFQAVFFMLPPLLSIAELQIPLPGNDTHWSSTYEQWQCLPPLQPTSNLCYLLARVGTGEVLLARCEPPALVISLLSAFVQQAAGQDILRAMRLGPDSDDTNHFDKPTALFQKAFEALMRTGYSQSLNQTGANNISNDFAIAARVLAIFYFTPPRLLFPYSRWQTTEIGQINARAELSEILSRNIGRTRHCLYHAVQVFQYFRATNVSTYSDVLGLLACVLYMALYIDVVEQPHAIAAASCTDTSRRGADILRLDQSNSMDLRASWLELKTHNRPHVTGIGVLASGRSTARLYKESSRIMANSASLSGMAGAMATILAKQAAGCSPDFQESQQATPCKPAESAG